MCICRHAPTHPSMYSCPFAKFIDYMKLITYNSFSLPSGIVDAVVRTALSASRKEEFGVTINLSKIYLGIWAP